jgi:hypothetical protein
VEQFALLIAVVLVGFCQSMKAASQPTGFDIISGSLTVNGFRGTFLGNKIDGSSKVYINGSITEVAISGKIDSPQIQITIKNANSVTIPDIIDGGAQVYFLNRTPKYLTKIGSNDKIRIHYCDPFPSVQDGIHDGRLLVPADPNTCG